jgi:hypothetical protein
MDYNNENKMEISTEKQDKVEIKDKMNNLTRNNDPTITKGKNVVLYRLVTSYTPAL